MRLKPRVTLKKPIKMLKSLKVVWPGFGLSSDSSSPLLSLSSCGNATARRMREKMANE
jgi:hypothetical protein